MNGVDRETVKLEDGTEANAVSLPDGYVVCLVPRELADGVWRECCAVRVVADDVGTVASLEVTNDEDWVTGPDAT